MDRLKENAHLDGSTFQQALEFRIGTFMNDFMRPYKEEFDWNNFFQFVVYFSLAPMVAVIYSITNIYKYIIHSRCKYTSRYQSKYNILGIKSFFCYLYRMMFLQ